MKIIRFSHNKKVSYGILEKETVRIIKGSPFGSLKLTGDFYYLEQVKLLAPCVPSKVVCLGLNYKAHAEETKYELPKLPLIFLKPSTSVIGPEDDIIYPKMSQQVDYEAELGVVIGKKTSHVSPGQAYDYILGYTCFNDITARDLQKTDGQWTRAKGFDTFAAMGPWIETELDPANTPVQSYLNGQLKQNGNTRDLIFPISEIVSFISQVMTLLPGDVIASGTPEGIGPMNTGDLIEIKIEPIGVLRNLLVKP